MRRALLIDRFDRDADVILILINEEGRVRGDEPIRKPSLLGFDHPRIDMVSLPDA
jgi:hypothetical protein